MIRDPREASPGGLAALEQATAVSPPPATVANAAVAKVLDLFADALEVEELFYGVPELAGSGAACSDVEDARAHARRIASPTTCEAAAARARARYDYLLATHGVSGVLDHLSAATEFLHDNRSTAIRELCRYLRDGSRFTCVAECTDPGTADEIWRRWGHSRDGRRHLARAVAQFVELDRSCGLAVLTPPTGSRWMHPARRSRSSSVHGGCGSALAPVGRPRLERSAAVRLLASRELHAAHPRAVAAATARLAELLPLVTWDDPACPVSTRRVALSHVAEEERLSVEDVEWLDKAVPSFWHGGATLHEGASYSQLLDEFRMALRSERALAEPPDGQLDLQASDLRGAERRG